ELLAPGRRGSISRVDLMAPSLSLGRGSRTLRWPGRPSGGTMPHYLLIYHLKDDYLERRPQFRAAHLELAKESVAMGDLVIGGALAEPADLGILWFKGESAAAAERFAQSDPYVLNGL